MDRIERLNTLTHLIGAVFALAGAVVLVVVASLKGDPWRIVSFSIYGVSLFTLYLFSTLYHGFNHRGKKLLKILDHQAIYLLIAGTYTPFTLVTLNGGWGWSLFSIIWGIAVLGIVLDALPITNRHRRIVPAILYLIMGWLIVVALDPLLSRLPTAGFIWLLAGGLFYTIGVIFFALSSSYKIMHPVWHLFVLAGSTCHFIAIFNYVA